MTKVIKKATRNRTLKISKFMQILMKKNKKNNIQISKHEIELNLS